MKALEVKKAAYSFCEEYAQLRLNRIQSEIEKIKEALHSEVKSTAGDKHETGRAMLQLEREKLGAQLAEAEKMKKVLDKVPIDMKNEKIGLGSLVETKKANYYISISAGRFTIDDMHIFCISPSTPIGKLLMGKSVNDSIQFNNVVQKIIKVY